MNLGLDKALGVHVRAAATLSRLSIDCPPRSRR
jgi:hypothetical protein